MIHPYQFKSGSKESGNTWSPISMDINTVKKVKFTTSQKSVRDRYKLLLEKHKKKMRRQIGESGSVAVETELDNLLPNIKDEAETFQEKLIKLLKNCRQQKC